MERLGVGFEILRPEIDEAMSNSCDPVSTSEELSLKKACYACQRIDGRALIIAADTLVFKGGRILGKPAGPAEAKQMLDFLQGEWHTVVTGFTVIDMYRDNKVVSSECTSVKIRAMPHELIDSYLSTGEPFDKAGAYGIQGYGALFVERIEGCYSNVVGLPLMRLGKVLSGMGVKLLSKSVCKTKKR